MLVIWASTLDLTQPRARLFGWLSLIAALLVWLAFKIRSREQLQIHRFALPLSAFVLLQVALVPASLVPQYGLRPAWIGLSALLTYFMWSDWLAHGLRARVVENALMILVGLLSFGALLGYLLWNKEWWDITGAFFSSPPAGFRASGPFLGHPNVMAGVIYLTFPIALVRFLRERHLLRRLLWLPALGLFLFVLYQTASRAGWGAAALGIGASLALLYADRLSPLFAGGYGRAIQKITGRAVAIGALLCILVAGIGLVLLQKTIDVGSMSLATARAEVWRVAWEMFSQSPLIGQGPGAYTPYFVSIAGRPPSEIHSHAHSLWFQTAAESGLLGLGLMTAAAVLLGGALFLSWKQVINSPADRAAFAAYAGSLIALTAHHTLDDLFQRPFYALLAVLILALATRFVPREGLRILGFKTGVAAIGAGILTLGALTFFEFRGALTYWDGLLGFATDGTRQAQEQLCRAVRRNPAMPLYWAECALALEQLQAGPAQAVWLDEASAALEQGLDVDPYWTIPQANLAALEWQRGQRDAALQLMRAATDAAPRFPIFHLNLGRMEEAMGNAGAAISEYRRALALGPPLAESPFFDATDLRRRAAAGYEQGRSPGSALSESSLEQLAGEGLSDALASFTSELEANPRDTRLYAPLAVIQLRMDMTEDALRTAREAIFLTGATPRNLQLVGRILRASGDDAAAAGYFERMYAVLRGGSYSNDYYYSTVRMVGLPTDLSPWFATGELTPQMVADLRWLAQYHQREGEEGQTQEIYDWLDASQANWR